MIALLRSKLNKVPQSMTPFRLTPGNLPSAAEARAELRTVREEMEKIYNYAPALIEVMDESLQEGARRRVIIFGEMYKELLKQLLEMESKHNEAWACMHLMYQRLGSPDDEKEQPDQLVGEAFNALRALVTGATVAIAQYRFKIEKLTNAASAASAKKPALKSGPSALQLMAAATMPVPQASEKFKAANEASDDDDESDEDAFGDDTVDAAETRLQEYMSPERGGTAKELAQRQEERLAKAKI